MNDYLESLFQGVDILIDKKLESVSYDSTLVCTIVDDSRKKDGVYKVTDGNIIYTAYSESDKYSNKEQVRVSILNGDYSEKKFIIGKYDIDSDSSPITYVSPLDSVLNISGNLVTFDSAKGIKANGGEMKKAIWSTSLKNQDYIELQRNGIYDSIILKADFKTFFNDYNLISGSYGLRIDLLIKPNPNSDSYIRRWAELDSKEMFGNPYSFAIYSTQAKIIKLDTFGIIDTVALSLYQTGDFKDSELGYIKPSKVDDILVKNIVLGFGSDLSNKEDNLLEIYTTNDLVYRYANHNADTNNKTLGLLWYNKDENNKYLGFSDGLYDPTYDEIEYLNTATSETRLTSRMGKENISTDKQSLTLCANIEEGEPLIKKACSVADVDLYQLLLQLQNIFPMETQNRNLVDTMISTLKNSTSTILENLPKLKDLYFKVLKYGYIYQTQGIRDTENWPTNELEEKYAEKIYNAFKTIKEDTSKMLIDIRADVSTNSTEFLSAYDTYELRINKILVTLNEYLGTAGNGYDHNFPKTIFEKDAISGQSDYDCLSSFSTKDIFKSYKELDMSGWDNKYCIYWYRYNKGYIAPNSEQGIMPNDWERILTDKYNVGLPSKGEVSLLDGKKYYNVKPDPGEGMFDIYLNHGTKEEKFVAVLFYNHDRIQSKELVFTNGDIVPDKVTHDKGDILKLEHLENSFDDYQIYSITNYLSAASEENLIRQIRCRYDGLLAKDEALVNAGIYWYMPINATMLTVDEDLLKERGFVIDKIHEKPGYTCFYKKITIKSKNGDVIDFTNDKGFDNRDFFYKIKPYYDHSALQNSLQCMVIPEGDPDPVYGEQFFTFGIKGTCGTKYTLAITNKSSSNITTTNNKKLELNVSLRDFDNKEIPITTDVVAEEGTATEFTVDWLMPETNSNILVTSGKVSDFSIEQRGCGIIKAMVSLSLCGTDIYVNDDDLGEGKQGNIRIVNLSSLHAIPWSNGNYYLSGPTQIVYNSMGTLDSFSMFDSSYKLYEKKTHIQVPGVTWQILYYNTDGKNLEDSSIEESERTFYKNYLPVLNETGGLTPANLYLDNLNFYPVVVAKVAGAIVWKQPIIILQNRYASTLLNNWDGSLEIDEKNGIIMSTMIGAGRKTSNNTFEGVLMGHVGAAAGVDMSQGKDIGLGNKEGLGIYGFHDGAQSFGFHTDGTAFIGKAGRGRIVFNGDYGIIASSNWFTGYTETDEDGNLIHQYDGGEIDATTGEIKTTSTDGMCIDLESGQIDAYNFKLTSKNIYLNSNPKESKDDFYFRFGGDGITEFRGQINQGRTPGYIAFNGEGDLEIKVNSLYLTEQLGGANLLNQTYPTKTALQYALTGTEINKDADGEILYQRDENDNLIFYWDVDTTNLYPVTSQWIGTGITGTDVIYEGSSNEENYTCIKVAGSRELAQQVNNILPQRTYVVSGYARKVDNDTTEKTFKVSIENTDPVSIVDNKNNIKITNEEWSYFEYVFTTKESVTSIVVTFEADCDFYLYHAKLELGGIATDWELSKWDVQNGTEVVNANYDKYLTQDKVFKKLVTNPNNGEQMVGIWLLDGQESASGHKELYINATYIATGILRSNNWDGQIETVKCPQRDESGEIKKDADQNILYQKDSYGKDIYTCQIKTHPTKGTYIDLNEGKIWAAKFHLIAAKEVSQVWTGLEINSNPSTPGNYFKVGTEDKDKQENSKLLQYYKKYDDDGNEIEILRIQTDNFNLKSGNNLIINSSTSANPMFYIGDGDEEYLQYSVANGLDIQTETFKLSAIDSSDSSKSIYLSNIGTSATINGTNRSNLLLKLGNDFGVSSSGVLYADNAVISGKITATELTATNKGTIGGWTIGGTTLTGGNLVLNGSTGAITSSGSGAFSIDANGVLTATGATLTTLYVNGLKAGGDASGSIASLAVTGDSVAISTAGTLGPKISFTTDGNISMQGGFTSYAGISDLPGSDVGVVVNVDTGFNTYTAITIRKGVIVNLSNETGAPSWGSTADSLGSGIADNSAAIAETNKKVDDLTNAVNAINSVPSYSASQSGKVLKVNSSGNLYWGTDNDTTNFAAKDHTHSSYLTSSGTISYANNVKRYTSKETYVTTQGADNYGGMYRGPTLASITGDSSLRFKKNITKIQQNTSVLYNLQPVEYYYKNEKIYGNNLRYGFVAEEVLKIAPELVEMDREQPELCSAIYYNSILTLAVAEIQNLRAELDELKSKK